MNLNDYQKAAARTLNPCSDATDDNYFLGLMGEGGELTDLVKKTLYHGHNIDHDKFRKEIGDTCWYIAANCSSYNIELLAAFKAGEAYFKEFGDKPLDQIMSLATLCRAYGRICTAIDDLRYGGKADNHWQLRMAILLGALFRIVLAIAKWVELEMDDILESNIAKLKLRYPESFTAENSINRIV